MKIEDFFTREIVTQDNCPNCNYSVTTINWDYIYSIPEFAALKTLHQSPKWHSESEYVSGHVEKVIKEAVDYIDSRINVSDYKEYDILLLAAIFHDIGKSTTTFLKESDGLWHHYGHEIESEKLTRRILWDLGCEVREPVCQLVRWHMEPFNIMKSKDKVYKMIDLSYKVPSIELLYLLKKFDMIGSVAKDKSMTKNDSYILDGFASLAKDLLCFYYPNHSYKTIRDIEYNTSKKPTITVKMYMGLPGAGKDTAITNANDRNDHCAVICRDDIRIELGYCKEGEKYLGTNDEENLVTKTFNEKLIKAANDGKTIILNNMNNRRKYRDEYKRLLKDYNVCWEYIYVEADSLQKNIDRRKGQINSTVFRKMAETFEYPTIDEYNYMWIVKS